MISGAPHKENKKSVRMNRKIKRKVLREANKKRNKGAQPRYTDDSFKFPLQKPYEMTPMQKRAKNKAKALRRLLRSF